MVFHWFLMGFDCFQWLLKLFQAVSDALGSHFDPERAWRPRTTCRLSAGTVPTGLRKEPSGFPGDDTRFQVRMTPVSAPK